MSLTKLSAQIIGKNLENLELLGLDVGPLEPVWNTILESYVQSKIESVMGKKNSETFVTILQEMENPFRPSSDTISADDLLTECHQHILKLLGRSVDDIDTCYDSEIKEVLEANESPDYKIKYINAQSTCFTIDGIPGPGDLMQKYIWDNRHHYTALGISIETQIFMSDSNYICIIFIGLAGTDLSEISYLVKEAITDY